MVSAHHIVVRSVCGVVVIGSWCTFSIIWRYLRYRHHPGVIAVRLAYPGFPAWTFHVLVLGAAAVVFSPIGRINGLAGETFIFAYTIGALIVVAGLVLALLGRAQLGANWSGGSAVIYREHRPIETGVYMVVRHPIYLGELCMAFGTAIWAVNWVCFIVLVVPLSCYNLRSGKD